MSDLATDKLLVTARLMDLVERLRRMNIKSYRVIEERGDGRGGVIFRISHNMSLWSWGENISIAMRPYNDMQTVVEVMSMCSMPTQVIDWGRNSRNLQDLMSYLLNGLPATRI